MEFYVKRKTLSERTIKHSDDELQHFGILGMKWGVRRYQNPDGTLTEAGRKRYGVGDVGDAKVGTEIKNGYFKNEFGKMAAKDKLGRFTDEYVDTAKREAYDENKYNPDFLKKVSGTDIIGNREEMLREYERFLISGDRNYTGPISHEEAERLESANKAVREMSKEFLTEREMMGLNTQRSIDAAVTGLNAIKKLGWHEDADPNNRYDQEWFMQEDQTFGLPQVADLANKGYSAEKIKKLIIDAMEAYSQSSWYRDYPYGEKGVDASGIWYLDESGGIGTDYVNACVDYNKKRSK